MNYNATNLKINSYGNIFDEMVIEASEKIPRYFANKIKHILIDEFQDFNPLFYSIIKRFLTLNPKINIFAVGDVAQLEGADWKAKQGHLAEVMARNAAENIIIKENNLPQDFKSYIHHINILCVMDTGNGAAFVYRSNKGGHMIPLPVIGHWMKKGWGWYCKNSKLGKIPRIPGM